MPIMVLASVTRSRMAVLSLEVSPVGDAVQPIEAAAGEDDAARE
jgi:hypothetical protein